MPQVTLYVDTQIEKLLDEATRAAGVSKSRWVADLIRRQTASHWPAAVRKAAGVAPDFPLASELRRGAGRDVKRVRV